MKALKTELVPTIQKKFPDKDIAFVAVRDATGDFFKLGVVVKNEAGYAPLPHQLAYGSEAEMQANADLLNDRALHLTDSQVAAYVAESMVTQRHPSAF